MSLTANITTEKINNVISVPSTAIKSNHTGEYVQILVNGKPIKVNVKTGLITNNGTEITSGLKSGEKVITQIISNKPSKSLNSLQSSGNLLKLNGGSGGRGGAKVRAGKL
jgi:multidrug efflux pump subunit AcrA (membrane-fusion protein)